MLQELTKFERYITHKHKGITDEIFNPDSATPSDQIAVCCLVLL